jgi:hypothetical protein
MDNGRNGRWPEPGEFWGGRRVCVTGGAGFLGSFVVETIARLTGFAGEIGWDASKPNPSASSGQATSTGSVQAASRGASLSCPKGMLREAKPKGWTPAGRSACSASARTRPLRQACGGRLGGIRESRSRQEHWYLTYRWKRFER